MAPTYTIMKVTPKYSAPNRTNKDPALANVPTKKSTEWIGLGVVTTVKAQAMAVNENKLNRRSWIE